MKKLIIIIIALLFFTTGCFNYRDLNDLAIVSALGIEKDGDDFLVSAEVINIKKGNNTGSSQENTSKVIIFKGKGKDIFSAERNMSKKMSKTIFIAHLKLLVLSKEIIENDYEKILEFLIRDVEGKFNFDVIATTENKASEILETLTPLNSIPSEEIRKLVENSNKLTGTSTSVTFNKLLYDSLNKGISPVLTDIKLTKNIEEKDKTKLLEESNLDTYIKANNLIIFDKNKVVNLNTEQSIGYNFINNNIVKSIITSKCPDDQNYFSIEMIKSKTGMKLKNKKLNISTNITASLGEINCKFSINKDNNREKLKKITQKTIKKYINSAIKKAKDEKIDFIGLGNYIYKNNTNYFDFKNKNWHKKGIQKLETKVNVKVTFIKEGNLDKNIGGEKLYE